MLRRLILIAVVVALGVPTVGEAGSLQFFDALAGEGSIRNFGTPSLTLDLDYNPSSAENGGIYGFGELMIVATGGISLDGFSCEATNCTPNLTGNTLVLTAGDDVNGEGVFFGSPGDFNLGQLSITAVQGVVGTVEITGGNYFDAFFGPQTVDPFVLAQSIVETPEPSALLLLGTGLAGLAFLRRRLA